MSTVFGQRLLAEVERKGSPCVVGLDPHVDLLPSWLTEEYRGDLVAGIVAYNKLVIDATADLVPMVKPQSAFYEVFGSKGILALEETIVYARSKGLLVLLDAKRGDMGSTNEAYASAYLDGGYSNLKVDSMTVNPYLGEESLQPFCRQAASNNAGLFILAVTSNPGATKLQGLVSDGLPIFLHVANMVRSLQSEYESSDGYSAFGIVAGATYPEEAIRLREALPNTWFLVPGMGSQGGNAKALASLFDSDGMGIVASSSRALMFPGLASGPEESSRLVRRGTEAFVSEINAVRFDKASVLA